MASREKVAVIRSGGMLVAFGVTVPFFVHIGSACRRLR